MFIAPSKFCPFQFRCCILWTVVSVPQSSRANIMLHVYLGANMTVNPNLNCKILWHTSLSYVLKRGIFDCFFSHITSKMLVYRRTIIFNVMSRVQLKHVSILPHWDEFVDIHSFSHLVLWLYADYSDCVGYFVYNTYTWPYIYLPDLLCYMKK